MSDFRERIQGRFAGGAIVLIVSAIVPALVLDDWRIAIASGAAGGALAGLIAGRSFGARVRYVPAAMLCAAGATIGELAMPQLASAGKYVDLIPIVLGGAAGAIVFLVVRDDATAADVRVYEEEERKRREAEESS